MADKVVVSVIIATCRKDARVIPTIISSLAKQTYQDFELIVVDDLASDARHAQLKTGLTGHRVVSVPPARPRKGGFCPAMFYNTGLREAKGDLVLYVGDLEEMPATLLAQHVAGYKPGPDSQSVIGMRHRQMKDGGISPDYGSLPSSGTPPNKWEWFKTNCSIPHAVARALDGFDETYDGARGYSDIDLAMRAEKFGHTFYIDKSCYVVALPCEDTGLFTYEHANELNRHYFEKRLTTLGITTNPAQCKAQRGAWDNRVREPEPAPVKPVQAPVAPAPVVAPEPAQPKRKRVAFISEQFRTYSGGRYHALLLALALCEAGYEVDFYTDLLPLSLRDFVKHYKMPRFMILKSELGEAAKYGINVEVFDRTDLISMDLPGYDAYFGCQTEGAICALRNGSKHRAPCYAAMFDIPDFYIRDCPNPNMKWMAVPDWGMIRGLLQAGTGRLIVSCDAVFADAVRWSGIQPSRISILPPSVNSRVADTVVGKSATQREVTVISQPRPHKNLDDAVNIALSLPGISRVNVITKNVHGSVLSGKPGVNVMQEVSDEEKFAAIARSKLLLAASAHEGFGMWVAEALRVHVPVVAYDLPTYGRTYQGRGMLLAPRGDIGTLKAYAHKMWSNEDFRQVKVREGASVCAETGFDVFVKKLVRIMESTEAQKSIPTVMTCVAKPRKRVAFLEENCRHYAGGRVHGMMVATALQSIGCDVDVFWDVLPAYVGDYAKYYSMPTLHAYDGDVNGEAAALAKFGVTLRKQGNKRVLELRDIGEYDVYVGTQTDGFIAACKCAEKHSGDVYGLMYDFPGFYEIWPGTSREWSSIWEWKEVRRLFRSTRAHAVVLCEALVEPFARWAGIPIERVHALEPGINSRAADSVLPPTFENIEGLEHPEVVIISRVAKNKNIDRAIEVALAMPGIEKVHVITAPANCLSDAVRSNPKVEIHDFPTDEEKFRIISRCRLMLSASTYEGYGMWAAESLYCGVPVVAFSFPTYQRRFGDFGMVYARYCDFDDLGAKALQVWSDPVLRRRLRREALWVRHEHSWESLRDRVFDVIPPFRAQTESLVVNLGYEYFSGGVLLVDTFAYLMARAGNFVTLVTDKSQRSTLGLVHPRLRTVVVQNWSNPENIPRPITKTEYDAVYNIHNAAVEPAVAYAKAYDVPLIPLVFEVPGHVSTRLPDLGHALEAPLEPLRTELGIARKAIVLSRDIVPYMRKWAPHTRTMQTLVFPGVVNSIVADDAQPEPLAWERKTRHAPAHIVIIGNPGPTKNMDAFMDVLVKNEAVGFAQKATIILARPLPSLTDRVKELKNTNVRILYNSVETEKYSVLWDADVLVVPSMFEPAVTVPTLEALYCGCQVACYDHLSYRDVLPQEYPAATVGDVTELALVTRRLCTDHDLDAVKRQAVDCVRTEYSIEACARKLEELTPVAVGMHMGMLHESAQVPISLDAFARCPFIGPIVVMEACDRLMTGLQTEDGVSRDSTRQALARVSRDMMSKVIHVPVGWVDKKEEYQSQALALLGGCANWVFHAGADMAMSPRELWSLHNVLLTTTAFGVTFPTMQYWRTPYIVATGGQWDSMQPLVCRFAVGMTYPFHGGFPTPLPGMPDRIENIVSARVHHYDAFKSSREWDAKLAYYRKRDEGKHPGIDKVVDTLTDWKWGQPTQMTHGGGTAEMYRGSHPPHVHAWLRERFDGRWVW